MANIFEFLSKDGNITPEKARKSRQMQFRDKCSFATKQRMFGVFAIDEILRYRGTRFPHFMPSWFKSTKSQSEKLFCMISIYKLVQTSNLLKSVSTMFSQFGR